MELNFWDYHGIWFLILITMFPRLTMLFATTFGGGILYWLGWFFAPRFTVAIIATMIYWQNNPYLVIFAWIVALTGEGAEKKQVASIVGGISSSRVVVRR